MSTLKNNNKIKSIKEKSQRIIDENKNIKEIEKRYLKGEKHKEMPEINEKEDEQEKEELIKNDANKNNADNSVSNNFLKEKLSNIDLNIKALNGINKGMEKQIKDIENDILENQILITEPKKKLNFNQNKSEKIINFEKRAKLKTIKGLTNNRNYLTSKTR